MFSHRNTGRRAAVVSLGILTMTAVAQAAQAEIPDPFVLVAYSNRAGGQPLMSGDYASAAQAVQSQGNGALADPQALDTNRCVAYAMTQQLVQARAACQAAVRAAAQESDWQSSSPRARQQSAVSAAVAYSNRAVLNWLDAQPAAAQRDLERAQALAPQAIFVARNMTAMRARQNVNSQVTATATLAGAHE
jgi:hypothetical protein